MSLRSGVLSLASQTSLDLYTNLVDGHLEPASTPVAPRITTSGVSRVPALVDPGLDDGDGDGVSCIGDSKPIYSYDMEDDMIDIYSLSVLPGNHHNHHMGDDLERNGRQRE